MAVAFEEPLQTLKPNPFAEPAQSALSTFRTFNNILA